MKPTNADIRTRNANYAPVNPAGSYVLYWMVANRRAHWNYSLDRAVDWARELNRPLVVFEALRCGHPWASDRLHHFVIRGMADNARRFEKGNAFYFPYLEPTPGKGKGLLEALAAYACVVVTDDFPAFFVPRMIAAAANKLPVRLEAVDANGLLPMRATDRVFATAYSFRRFLQKTLPTYLPERPWGNPLKGVQLPIQKDLPKAVRDRWPPVSADLLKGGPAILSRFPIDHHVGVVKGEGGSKRARERLADFLENGLPQYSEKRNGPEADVTSGIFWVLGRYDRAWGPQRPVFGKIRYMSSKNTARKVRVKGYVVEYGA